METQMENQDARSAGLQPLFLEHADKIIGGALAPGPDTSDTGSTGGSQGATANPEVGIQIAG